MLEPGLQHVAAAIEPVSARLGREVRIEEIASSCDISLRVRQLRDEHVLPLVVSGDGNAALETVSGCRDETTSIVWFGAHGEWQALLRPAADFDSLPGSRILLVVARDLEPAEQDLLERAGVRRAPHPDELFDAYAPLRSEAPGVYLHLDLDVLMPGGLSVDALIRGAADIGRLSLIEAIGIASYHSVADVDGSTLLAALAIVDAALNPPERNHDRRPLTGREVLQRYVEENVGGFYDVALTDVNQVNSAGDRPLHTAGWRGDAEEVEALLEAGAEINAVGEFGYLPIHCAVSKGNIEAVRLLLEQGAFPDVPTEWGFTAIDQARREDRQDLVDLLMRYRRSDV